MTNPNDVAYPLNCDDHRDFTYLANSAYCGLTKHEYFAAMALSGLLARDGMLIERAIPEARRAADLLVSELNK